MENIETGDQPSYPVVVTGTPMIVMLTGEYPIYFDEVKRRHPWIGLPREPYYHQMIELGYGVVEWTDRPEGNHYQYVVEDTPQVTAEYGVYKRAWKFVDYTAEELATRLDQEKNRLRSMLEMREAEALDRGFEHTFSDGKTGFVQMRTSDRVNFLGRLYKADMAKAANQMDVIFTWATSDDEVHELFTQEMIDLALACGDAYEAVLERKRALITQIKNTDRIENLPAIPETL